MKKISKITLENFRVFSGKREISFNNSNNQPADFICIYGKNGFGKTSLFDGFEWFFTGEIHLLQKDLKNNITRYEGNVLKNRYASENEGASISVEFSDGKCGRRTVVKRYDSINDYNKGKPSGECKELINKKQILPHSKIDSFVYASKPESMYNEWGNFWDPNNKQRNLFQSIYNVYKEMDKEKKDCNEQLHLLSVQLSDINIEEKVVEYNKTVSEYNRLFIPEIGKLESLQYRKNEKVNIDSILSGEKVLHSLNSYISEQRYLSEQCLYLEKHFNEYVEFQKYEQELYSRKKRWSEIIRKCYEKKELIEKKQNLLKKIDRITQNKNDIEILLDRQWFIQYEKYIETKTTYTKINEDLQNNDLHKQKICSQLDICKESQKSYIAKLKNLSDNYIQWISKIQELEVQEKSILNKNQQNILIEKIKENQEMIDQYEKERQYLLKASGEDYDKFVLSLEKDEILLYNWIMQFYERIKKIKDTINDYTEKEKKSKYAYQKMKDDIDNLDELLTLAKKEIQKENMNICPVCKSTFTNTQELLKKIDLSAQQEMLSLKKEEWDSNRKILKEVQENYKNENQNISEDLENMLYKNQQLIIDFQNKIAAYKKQIKDNELYCQHIEAQKEIIKSIICNSIEEDTIELTEPYVKEAYEKRKTDLSAKIDKYNNKIGEIQKNIDKLSRIIDSEKEILEDLEKNKKCFYDDINNKQKLDILAKRNLFSYDDYLSLIKEYNYEIEKYLSSIKEIDKLLQVYKIYHYKNVEQYSSLVSKLNIPEEGWVDIFRKYKNSVFKKKTISHKTILHFKMKLDSKVDMAQKKIEALSRCLSDLSIKESINTYNRLEEERIKLQEKEHFVTRKLEIAEKIFFSAQRQLEEHIKNVFGGITISHIYEKIEPHKRFRQLEYQIGFNNDGVPELYIKVLNDKEEGVIPELFFSSAQLNTVALSVFLGGALTAINPKIKTIFIDDPIGHFDDLNVLSFIDVLRTIISETDWQLIISTHEENFYEIMKVKLNPKHYNSKFLVFEDEATLREDNRL